MGSILDNTANYISKNSLVIDFGRPVGICLSIWLESDTFIFSGFHGIISLFSFLESFHLSWLDFLAAQLAWPDILTKDVMTTFFFFF